MVEIPLRQQPQHFLCMSVQSETESPASLSPSAAEWMLTEIHREKKGNVSKKEFVGDNVKNNRCSYTIFIKEVYQLALHVIGVQ